MLSRYEMEHYTELWEIIVFFLLDFDPKEGLIFQPDFPITLWNYTHIIEIALEKQKQKDLWWPHRTLLWAKQVKKWETSPLQWEQDMTSTRNRDSILCIYWVISPC